MTIIHSVLEHLAGCVGKQQIVSSIDRSIVMIASHMHAKGEDMHHGYYPTPDYKDHKAAQIGMIDRSLKWAYGEDFDGAMNRMKAFIDVGCGVGGSSRHIARTYGNRLDVTGVGISLSPYQIQRANQFTEAANLTAALTYKVEDAMNTSFADGSFDLGM